MILRRGDMVVLLRIETGSPAYAKGARAGMIGTVRSLQPCPCGCGLDAEVDLHCGGVSTFPWWLRKVEPPERGNWHECVWRPRSIVYEQRARDLLAQ